MKTEISRDSHQADKRYSGVYQQQGRMLTDADWNELVDILKARLNDSLKDVVGNRDGSFGGTPRHGALGVVSDTDDIFKIKPGIIYTDGLAARSSETANIAFTEQSDFAIDVAPGGDYILYADIWERSVTHLIDGRLLDSALHGADTCTRKQTIVQIKSCAGGIDPEQSDKNPRRGNAPLSVTLLPKSTIADTCDPCAAELDVESRVGNYLFRTEVHAISGDVDSPTAIILKWSSENGAEQFAVGKEPDTYKAAKWAYEFFDESGEKHLGVQLQSGFTVDRDELTKGYPDSVPTRQFVRRWDGFCKLELSGSSWSVTDEFDASQSGSEAFTFTEISSGSLIVNLDNLKLAIDLSASFVVGDFWLAEVREAAYDESDAETSKLLEDELPHGIEHHYLTLAEVIGDVLQNNPEIDRKYAFPALTEMTRLFLAGGDGQEVMPGAALPQPLRVGVANGEWPVVGATVRFQIEDGGGSLAEIDGGKTNGDGIAACEWSPDSVIGDTCRVKATLVNPDGSSSDFMPPVYFYANLVTADQVAYVPACPASGENAVHSLLTEDVAVGLDLGTDTYYSVKEVLDALLCKLRAKHLPYDPTNLSRWTDVNEEEGASTPQTVQQAIDALLENLHSEDIVYPLPSCPTANTLKDYLQAHIAHITEDGASRYRIKALWDALLCHLDAAKLPYNPNVSTTTTARWRDIKELSGSGNITEPNTVQEAIDDLIVWLESTDIRYLIPECGTAAIPTVRFLLGLTPGTDKVDTILDELLCNLNARHLPFFSEKCSRVGPTVKSALGLVNSKTVYEVLQALICGLDASTIPFDVDSASGSLLDGFVNADGDTMSGDLDVTGTVKATAFEGDGSALTGIDAGKWSDGSASSIYYNAGNVGIGTASPVFRFHHSGGDHVIEDSDISLRRAGLHRWRLQGLAGSGFTIRQNYNDANSLSNSVRFQISDIGNVGIGTTSPSHKLDVQGNVASHLGHFQNVNNGSGTTTGIYVDGDARNTTGSQGRGALLYGRGSTQGGTAYGSQHYAFAYGNSPAYAVYANGAGGSTTGREYAFYGIGEGYFSSNLGIGITPNASYRLYTNGTSYATKRAGGGIDYAEYFESSNGKAIAIGASVVLDQGKVRKAKKSEIPFGVISANPIIVGGVHTEWPKKYLRDEFGALIKEEYQREVVAPKIEKIDKERQKTKTVTVSEEVTRSEIVYERKKYCQKQITETVSREEQEPVFKEVDLYDASGKKKLGKHQVPVMENYEEEIEVLDENGQPVLAGTGQFTTDKRPKLNPDYDENKTYIAREQRPEWNCVGLLGQLALRRGEAVAPSWVKIRDITDKVELWLVK